MNIHVVYWDLHDEVKGFYKYNRRNKYIFINNNLFPDMKQFVCFRELGHGVIHPHSNTPFLRKNTLFSIDKIEVEANTFLPDEIIYNYQDTNMTIQEVGGIYGVPEEVAHLKKFLMYSFI